MYNKMTLKYYYPGVISLCHRDSLRKECIIYLWSYDYMCALFIWLTNKSFLFIYLYIPGFYKCVENFIVDDLFGGDEQEDDMFGSSNKPPGKKEPTPKSSFEPPPMDDFDDNDDEDDLFSTTKPKKPSETVKKPVAKSDNLFGKSPVESDDLFGRSPPAPKSDVAKKDNSHDLFGSSPPAVDDLDVQPESPPKASNLAPKPWKPAGAVSMFGGADILGAKLKSKAIESKKFNWTIINHKNKSVP